MHHKMREIAANYVFPIAGAPIRNGYVKFNDNNEVVEDVSKDMFVHEPDIAPYHHCRTMFIECKTSECIFNKQGECYSNGVFIGSEKFNAPCNSFVPR